MPSPERQPTSAALILYYVLQYSTGGILLPFFPQYLKTLGYSGTEVGLLLALGPTLSLVAPPMWGQLADRTGRPGRVLVAVTAGSAIFFSLLLFSRSYAAAFTTLLLYSVCSAAISTVIDSIALRHVARAGGSYARLRLFGSLGFAAASLVFGRLITRIDAETVRVPLVLMAAASIWAIVALRSTTSTVAPTVSTRPTTTFSSAIELARDPQIRLFLIVVALHWIACGPYHSALSIHVTQMNLPPSVVGDTATVGVISEVLVMLTWPRWGHLIEPRRLLAISFVASGFRWGAMALIYDGTVLAALTVIHSLTFGAFFLSSVAFMAERVPDSLRATGQALYVTAAYGIGGVIGFLATGVALDFMSSFQVFAIAGALELIPALLVLRLTPLQPAAAAPA